MSTVTRPVSELDLFSDEIIQNPHDAYRHLRDTGPAVWMELHDYWAVTRHADVAAALNDYQLFSSASGIGLNEALNSLQTGVLVAEPPVHPILRRVLGSRLTPRSLRDLEPEFQRIADDLVDRLIEKGTFEGVQEFATKFPLSVVPDLLGCPPEDRDMLLVWSAGGFDAAGPMNERAQAGFEVLVDLFAYTTRLTQEGGMAPNGWWSDMLAKARENNIPDEDLPGLLVDFLSPSMDTTINALSTAIWQMGVNPDQWDKVRADRTLIDNIVEETVRFEAPARGFARLLTQDVELEGTQLKAGERVFLSYASANRDERFWENPDRFDVERDTTGHVGFGSGIHQCLGRGLAKLEARVLFNALADKVSRIEVDEPTWKTENILRGIGSMHVTLHA